MLPLKRELELYLVAEKLAQALSVELSSQAPPPYFVVRRPGCAPKIYYSAPRLSSRRRAGL